MARSVHPTLVIAGLATAVLSSQLWSQESGSFSGERQVFAGPDALEEIVVTARRRAERAQDVPIAMSVVGADTLADTRTNSLGRLQQLVPSVFLFGYNARSTSISIRGLGANTGLASDALESGVGVFIDDVYLGRVGPAMFDLMDIERVEVLRGPQGTLFGRNTTAGAISIVTKGPSFDALATEAQATVGDYGLRELKGAISGPLIGDKLAGRASIANAERDGYMHNVYTGEDVQNFDHFMARGQLLFAPAGSLAIRVTGDYARQDSNCCAVVSNGVFTTLDSGAPVPNSILARSARLGHQLPVGDPFARTVHADSPMQSNMDQRGLAAQIDWSLPGIDVISITARREWEWEPRNDGDDLSFPAITALGQANRQTQTSQELRVASSGERRVDYVAGLYHFSETVDAAGIFAMGSAAPQWFFPPTAPQPRAVIDMALLGFAVEPVSTSDTSSNAIFGNGIWHVTDAFDVTAGLRYTGESRAGRFEQGQVGQSLAQLSPSEAAAARAIRDSFGSVLTYTSETDDEDLSGSVTLSYDTRFGPSYVTVAEGYKSGGLNLGNFTPGIDLVVQPEDVRHYEIGAKTRVGSALLNAAFYRTRVSDYQTSVLAPNAAGRPTQYISNIDEARSEGFELDFSWSPQRWLALSAAVAFVDANYESFPRGPCPPETSVVPAQCDLSQQRLPGSPRRAWSLGIAGDEAIANGLELYWRLDYNRRSEVNASVSNSRYTYLDDLELTNLGIGLRSVDRRWDLMLWVRNALDEDYFQFIQARTTGWLVGLPGEPRTGGLTVRAQF